MEPEPRTEILFETEWNRYRSPKPEIVHVYIIVMYIISSPDDFSGSQPTLNEPFRSGVVIIDSYNRQYTVCKKELIGITKIGLTVFLFNLSLIVQLLCFQVCFLIFYCTIALTKVLKLMSKCELHYVTNCQLKYYS